MEHTARYLGIDVGSVSTNLVVIGDDEEILFRQYLRTSGQPTVALRKGLLSMREEMGGSVAVRATGVTGSGRNLAGAIVGADIVKNEITAHAVAALKVVPGVRTVLEIGGQDSKIILLRDGMVYDFAMNTVCAAGTGSFLDRQASRLEIPIERFGALALQSRSPVRIAGRCAVFAESDMIHKQQSGHSTEDIVNGLCEALVRNYLNNLAKGKELSAPVVFQGGVAANVGIVRAFEKALGLKVTVPRNYDVMGAYGAALLAAAEAKRQGFATRFRGFDTAAAVYSTGSFECSGCVNRCEVVQLRSENGVLACWNDRCGKWSTAASTTGKSITVSPTG